MSRSGAGNVSFWFLWDKAARITRDVTPIADPLAAEIARNFDFFQRTLAQHLDEHAGEYALLRGARVHDFFGTIDEADHAGWTRFPDHLYSVQRVTAEPVELGVYANGLD